MNGVSPNAELPFAVRWLPFVCVPSRIYIYMTMLSCCMLVCGIFAVNCSIPTGASLSSTRAWLAHSEFGMSREPTYVHAPTRYAPVYVEWYLGYEKGIRHTIIVHNLALGCIHSVLFSGSFESHQLSGWNKDSTSSLSYITSVLVHSSKYTDDSKK